VPERSQKVSCVGEQMTPVEINPKKTKYYGTAIKVRSLRKNFYTGSALYRVSPKVEVVDCGFLTETNYVICAVTPCASDHGKPETALFAAKANGLLFCEHGAEHDLDAAANNLNVYIKGKQDHQAAFDKLQGGYKILKIGKIR